MSSQFPFFNGKQTQVSKDKKSKKLYDKLLPLVEAGNVEETRKLLEAKVNDLNSEHAFNLLSIAINAINRTMVNCLCQYIQIEKMHAHYENVLIVAIKTEDEPMVQLLLARGAGVFLKNHYAGPASKCAAIETGNKNILKILVSSGVNFEPIERFDAHGLKYTYSQTSTAAVLKGDEEIMTYLLDNGAKINARDYHSGTPLYIAAQNSNRSMAEFLIQNGAEINNMGGSVGAALHIAAKEGHWDIVQLLLDHGADVNVANEQAETPLHMAVQENHIDVAMLLLEHGADIHLQNKEGKTPCELVESEAMQALFDQAVNNGLMYKQSLKM